MRTAGCFGARSSDGDPARKPPKLRRAKSGSSAQLPATEGALNILIALWRAPGSDHQCALLLLRRSPLTAMRWRHLDASVAPFERQTLPRYSPSHLNRPATNSRPAKQANWQRLAVDALPPADGRFRKAAHGPAPSACTLCDVAPYGGGWLRNLLDHSPACSMSPTGTNASRSEPGPHGMNARIVG